MNEQQVRASFAELMASARPAIVGEQGVEEETVLQWALGLLSTIQAEHAAELHRRDEVAQAQQDEHTNLIVRARNLAGENTTLREQVAQLEDRVIQLQASVSRLMGQFGGIPTDTGELAQLKEQVAQLKEARHALEEQHRLEKERVAVTLDAAIRQLRQ